MGIPKKALRRKHLQDLTAGSTAIDGSHQIIRVHFIEDGIQKTGFFKQLEPKRHYPELLAKMSVATSVLARSFLGDQAAEERLVFDDNDKLVGTLSIAIEDFRPFNYTDEPVPSDPDAKEQVVPSTKTLIKNNFIPAAFTYWFGDNDDGHPHNYGFAPKTKKDPKTEKDSKAKTEEIKKEAKVLDYDMFFYWFTIWMKEPRPVIGNPKKNITLSVPDWETFPIVHDSKPYHWCTYDYPGQETLPGVTTPILKGLLPKKYADPTQFAQLAHESVAHEQKLAIALRTLLTYQPELIRKRLLEQFGDLTLNYSSLDDTDVALRVKYEKEFPNLCNSDTNAEPFVDFMMKLYQKHYDNLYRVVVFYMGCSSNKHGVSLPATCSALYNKPSYYKTVVKWVTKQNKRFYSSEEQAQLRYDLTELQKRYHQIWRDAYAPTVNDLLHNCYQLTNKVLFLVSKQKMLEEVEGKSVTDDSLTNAWEMIGSMPELSKDKIEPLISVEKDHGLRNAVLLMAEFTEKLQNIVKAYYEKKRKNLTENDNILFASELNKLYEQYNKPLRTSLAFTSSHAVDFNRIALILKQLAGQVDFELHLTSTDEQMKDVISTTVVKDTLPHTHEEVIKQFNETLFLWAKKLKSEELNQYINNIVDTHYAPYVSVLSNRQRTQPVKEFLRASMQESGDNRLAYIFSSGNEEGALNQLLIQHLTPHMLQSYPILSIRNAVREDTFNKDILAYSKATVAFAKHDKRFTHLHTDAGIKLFYKTMYDWVEHLDLKKFKAIVSSALKEYQAKLWFGTSRKDEVKGYFQMHTNQAKILAFIFLNGEKTSTFSSVLFQKIVAGMKSEIGDGTKKDITPGERLIMQYNPLEDIFIYDAVKTYAEEPSQALNMVRTPASMVH